MNTFIKRVPKADFEREIEDYMVSGWSVKNQTDRIAIVQKNEYGKPVIHIIVFIFTFWWTALLGNIVYAIYSYMKESQEIHIKVDDSVASGASQLDPQI